MYITQLQSTTTVCKDYVFIFVFKLMFWLFCTSTLNLLHKLFLGVCVGWPLNFSCPLNLEPFQKELHVCFSVTYYFWL